MIATLTRLAGLVAVLLAAFAAAPARAGPTADVPSVRRFALVVGANDGGPDRVTLRYASSDAKAISRVLRDLGGVETRDHIRVIDPSPEELEEVFARAGSMTRRARGKGRKVQFIFYYSGHSDEQGLLLGGRLFSYRDLRNLVRRVPADVRIAILDSCASGAFTRLKGGKKRAPFLVGGAADVEGHAFLTSASQDEAAQESDRIKGSFFTHFLASGLRGAADMDGDRVITLSEAYQFAFDETLARTQSTRGGAQHAAYEIQLTGSGDLVMTDLRRQTARLEIAKPIGGRVFVRSSSGDLAAELYKPRNADPVLLALEPGSYEITVDEGEGAALWRGKVEVKSGNRTELTSASLFAVPREGATSRGGPADKSPKKIPKSKYVEIPFNLGLFPPLSINGQYENRKVRNKFSIAAVFSRVARLDGAALALGAVVTDDAFTGLQASMAGNLAHGTGSGVQFSQFFNYAANLRGAQFSFVNVGRKIQGAQLGIINIATDNVEGAQVGVFNYANAADAQVGVIGGTKEGKVKLDVWTSDTAGFNLGMRLPARYTYGMLAIGMHPGGNGAGWLFGGAFGGHIPLRQRLFLDIDIGYYASLNGLKGGRGVDGLAQLRALVGIQLHKSVALFGGPTVGAFFDYGDDARGRPGYGWHVRSFNTPEQRISIWPGFAVGLRFF